MVCVTENEVPGPDSNTFNILDIGLAFVKKSPVKNGQKFAYHRDFAVDQQQLVTSFPARMGTLSRATSWYLYFLSLLVSGKIENKQQNL